MARKKSKIMSDEQIRALMSMIAPDGAVSYQTAFDWAKELLILRKVRASADKYIRPGNTDSSRSADLQRLRELRQHLDKHRDFRKSN